jgi:hypothetical protein
MKLKTVYLALCVVGAALPLWQLVPWLAANGLDVPLLFRQLFADRVGAFFGLDVIVSAVVLAVFVWGEGSRVPLRWLALAATLAVGVSLGFPLFLYMRERGLERRATAVG